MSIVEQKITFIYALVDPRNDAIRYVGKTHQWLGDRLSGHLNECKDPRRQHWRKTRWMKSLLRQGIRPRIDIIETVSPWDDWRERETYWINRFRSAGCDLTNLTDGGEGALNRVLSEETKRKISQKAKGRRHPMKGKKMRPEAYQNVLDACYKILPEHVMARLGKVPDRELAREIGVSTWLIKKRRQENGIPEFVDLRTPSGYNPDSWSKEHLALLGKKRDSEVVEITGISLGIVREMRDRLGIPPYKKQWRDAIWTEENLSLLGTMSDYALADKLGVHVMTVNKQRRDLGIPAFRECKMKNRQSFTRQSIQLNLFDNAS